MRRCCSWGGGQHRRFMSGESYPFGWSDESLLRRSQPRGRPLGTAWRIVSAAAAAPVASPAAATWASSSAGVGGAAASDGASDVAGALDRVQPNGGPAFGSEAAALT